MGVYLQGWKVWMYWYISTRHLVFCEKNRERLTQKGCVLHFVWIVHLPSSYNYITFIPENNSQMNLILLSHFHKMKISTIFKILFMIKHIIHRISYYSRCLQKMVNFFLEFLLSTGETLFSLPQKKEFSAFFKKQNCFKIKINDSQAGVIYEWGDTRGSIAKQVPPSEWPGAQRDQLVRSICPTLGNHACIQIPLGKLTSTSGKIQSFWERLARPVLFG